VKNFVSPKSIIVAKLDRFFDSVKIAARTGVCTLERNIG
jgi:hypothetical protein